MNKFKTQLPTILAAIFAIAILIGSFCWFSKNTDKMIETTTKSYLEMNARSQAAAFNIRLANQVDLLQAAAQYWTTVDMNDPAAVAAHAKELAQFHNYIRVTVISPDGSMIDNTGTVVTNVASAGFFKLVMEEGKTVITDMVHYDKSFGEYLYIAVPIQQNGANVGAIYGQFPLSMLSDLIETVGFQETSTSLLMASDGTIIARSHCNTLVTDRIINFYDLGTRWGLDGKISLMDIKLDIVDGKTSTIPYLSGERERLAILTPIGLNNWYYAIVISQDIIHDQSKTVTLYMLYVIIAISFAFAMLFITISHLLHHTAVIELTNDRFRMASSQSHAIVFDYDFQKQHLALNGSLKFIMPDARDSYNGEEINHKLAKLVHESDHSIIQALKDLRDDNTSSITREMRVLCADGDYYWHRITGTVIRDANGKALRLVGNFVNVEDEVAKQLQLKQKAEIDPLSGLLNKGAFTSYVSELLAKSTDENLYAFYIIDLDNFKKVNDTLGHIVGDRVISDVSQKLCTVFSENDFVGRIGGDEFAAFLKLSGSGLQIGRKIIEAKAQAACALIHEVYSDGQNEVTITASIGVALYPQNGKRFDELYKKADSVLYTSKNGGKNQYTICE